MRRAGIPVVVAVVHAVVVPIAVAVIRRVIVPIIMAHRIHTGFHEAALVVTELAFLIPAIFGEDVQRLVFSYGGIPPHWLIFHFEPAIHATPLDEGFENFGDCTPPVLETIVITPDPA